MKIFILEDDRARQTWFLDRFEGHDVTLIESNKDAHKFEGFYDLICLDHDLGGRQLVDHEDCGLMFVKNMKNYFADSLVLIHSYNPDGAIAMKAEHPMAIIAPFGGAKFRNIIAVLLKDGKR